MTKGRPFRAQFTDRRPSIQTVQTEPLVETKVCITPLFETSKTERFACQASVWRLLSATKCHYRFSMIDSCNFPSRSLRGKPERPHRIGCLHLKMRGRATRKTVHHESVSLWGFTPVNEKRGIEAEVNLTSSLQSAKKLVDVAGLEPATPCLQSRCSPN